MPEWTAGATSLASCRLMATGILASATDVELILRAYQVWGEDCVERLLGDFCFAIWDAPRRRLFCARDQMGVKPFFYAHLGSCFIFSNTLDCVRQHPAVSDRINDLAIADFLVYDMSQDPGATAFVDIRRLPPGARAHLRIGQRLYSALLEPDGRHHRFVTAGRKNTSSTFASCWTPP